MKKRIIKKLHQIQMQILKADDAELNKIGVELLEIEKKLMLYTIIIPKQYKHVVEEIILLLMVIYGNMFNIMRNYCS